MSAAGTVHPPLRGKSHHRPTALKPPSRCCNEDFCGTLTGGKEVGIVQELVVYWRILWVT